MTRGYKNGAWFLVMAADFGGISSYEFEQEKTNHNTVYKPLLGLCSFGKSLRNFHVNLYME